ncbi:cytochrome c [Roseivivax sp. GX 12232]|uniref:c-type cytochrome n=1 Tax=Roseivivax sp. GX 12232 TaxID=2900547 RepID=UPI001E2D16E6|nr:cytochrome c [Roseivivax sp. GX 12232]MCE0507227.1 cytochrome c [Roseivivax sp. GX 12232]
MRRTIIATFGLGLSLAALAACDPGSTMTPAAGTSATTTNAAMPGPAEGARLYTQYCATCHGADGKGDGPMARAMRVPPKNLTLLAVRSGDSFPAARVLSTVDGYARSDLDGPGMPEFGELLAGDLVPYDSGDGVATPTPRKLVALVEYLRSIQATR